MKVRIRAIPILVALHLGSSAIAEEREILHLVEDAEFQNYIDSVDIVLASASRSPLHTAAERIIFFSEAGAIKDNKIDVSPMWFLGGAKLPTFTKIWIRIMAIVFFKYTKGRAKSVCSLR